MITAEEIQADFYNYIKSNLSGVITGSVYQDEMRPKDSELEDAVVMWSSGTPGQVDEGVVTILIFVPDITLKGRKVKDGNRCLELSTAASGLVGNIQRMQDKYFVSVNRVISCYPDDEIHQHFISVRLNYKYFDNN